MENYPKPPYGMKQIFIRYSDKKAGYQMWRIVHPDIWNILNLADTQLLQDFFQSHFKDGTIFTEHTVLDGPQKGWYGQRHNPITECLPPDLYRKLSNSGFITNN